jgi:NAD(P)-dependent dehydrogenase (short-subunit alcohol dehydrogenase family)
MDQDSPIIVVTGGNRGIGFEICRQLARRGARVLLTARSSEAGMRAVRRLTSQNVAVQFCELDVTKPDNATALRDFLDRTFGRVDVLINNAGILPKEDAPGLEVKLSTVRTTLETNALAALLLSQELAPLLRRSHRGRIVNLSSSMAALSEMNGDHAAYRLSKTALNAVTAILAAELRGKVAVNSVSPGWVRTEMGGANAERDVSQGADTAVWLALDAPQELSGRFFRDRKIIPW